MLDYFRLAGEAIEEVVAKLHPQSSGNWALIKPISVKEGWGLQPIRWMSEGRMIQRAFHDRIKPKTITIPNIAIQTAGSSTLDEFQLYLDYKARHEA
jgi:hypothetical protein